MAKLSCALQTKLLDLSHISSLVDATLNSLSLISSLVDATLNSLDDAILPSVNWVLQLQDVREEKQQQVLKSLI